MMTWLFPALTAVIANTAVMVFIYGYFYIQERKVHIKIWALGWGFYLLRFVFELLQYFHEERFFLSMLNAFVTVVSGFLLIWGTYIFLNKKLPRFWLYGTIVCIGWFLISQWRQFSFTVSNAVIFAFLGAIYIRAGLVFLRSRDLEGAGKKITGVTFVLWGIHKLNYPFIKPILWLAPWGYLIGAVFALVAAIGILLTYLEKTRKTLIETEGLCRLLQENARDIILFIRYSDGQIIEGNRAALQAYGYTAAELTGLKLIDLRAEHAAADIRDRMLDGLERGALFETCHCRKDGSVFPVEVSLVGVNIGDEPVLFAIVRDITERRKAEKQLEYLSSRDALTGLYNRHTFVKEVQKLDDSKITPIGIVVCDVDGLKLVNDTFGHKQGDLFITRVAKIIEGCFPDTDRVYRFGGDEFIVVLPGSDMDMARSAAERISAACGLYRIGDQELYVDISVGFAVRTEPDARLEDIIHEADKNMYKEKLHRNRSHRSGTVKILSKMLEVRDFITEGHIQRMKELLVKLAAWIGLSNARMNDLALFAELHDIGKVGVSDKILFKQGLLDSKERLEMQRHCEIGHSIALASPEIMYIADWILKHHEWWNGRGYPLGLKGDDIPFECRLLAIVDAYDAMTNDRPHRKGMTHDQAVAELQKGSGSQFDPELLTQFLDMLGSSKAG